MQSTIIDTGAPADHPQYQPRNPTQLERPAFLLNAPFSYSTEAANNVWMEELRPQDRVPDMRRAMAQFLDLYRFLAGDALVCILPTPRIDGLQDLVFTGNLGIVLTHLERTPVVVSNFASEPRRDETEVGVRFFELFGYETHVAPHKFEGEAELKHLHGNVYAGGYGQRSEPETYSWMEQVFDMDVVKVREKDPYLYHVDCTIFPITREDTLVCTELFEREEVAELEKRTNIIDVSYDHCFAGICNSVRCANTIVNSSHIHELKAGTEDYQLELRKNRKLEDIAAEHAMEVSYLNLSEYHKGGALLSCMVMHLNRYSYEFTLL
ncbi:dimethylarginine dimethylaminohydrolase family protein [Streptomyces sp. NK08204]|uniref:dimethylarginine dimethylaminohydrolase family protein n=1 Tax=Streptomyces sp. NK08204 TaxID=2873260 RepID=UPI001CEC7710|nr:arginine deiminase-related protein [Streptomyces sp. NK08204]